MSAPGIDGIQAEILHMPWQTLLNPFLGKFGKQKKMPTEWKSGIIVKIPKK
jgi:hypothetical protein